MSATHSIVTVPTVPLQIGSSFATAIILKDKYANLKNDTELPLLTAVETSTGKFYKKASLTDLSSAAYSASFEIPTSIMASNASNCGNATVTAYQLSHGLRVKKFANMYLAGAPVEDTLESKEINYNWGEGEIIQGLASNYISLEWSGFLHIPASETYTWYLESSHKAELYIGNRHILSASNSSAQSHPLELSQDSLLPIRLTFIEETGSAHLALK